MTTEPRVLIIENNEALRAMLFAILRHQPVGVDTASTANQALEKVTSCDYALMLIDMDMPGAWGRDFLGDFVEARPEATTFVIAVRDPKNDVFLDPDIVSAVLNKPLEIDTLAELVRECALVVPRPDDPLRCPPSESEVRAKLDKAPYLSN